MIVVSIILNFDSNYTTFPFWIAFELMKNSIFLSYACVNIVLPYFSCVHSTAYVLVLVFASEYLCVAFVCSLSTVYKIWFIINVVKMKMTKHLFLKSISITNIYSYICQNLIMTQIFNDKNRIKCSGLYLMLMRGELYAMYVYTQSTLEKESRKPVLT